MDEFPVTASTQYGDFKGTVSIDGFNGPFLEALCSKAKLSAGFVPVGFSLSVGEPGPGSMYRSATPLMERSVHISLYATNQIAGGDGNAIAKYVAQHGSVRVQSFDVEMGLEDFFGLVKRFTIVANSRILKHVEMVSESGD